MSDSVGIIVQGNVPKRGTPGSAGFDLIADHDQVFSPGDRVKIDTGTAVAIPYGVVGYVFERSSLRDKFGLSLVNGVGVIDSDFRKNILLHLENVSSGDVEIRKGDRLAQVVFQPCFMGEIIPGDVEDTGRGGFGSTGTN